MGLVDHYRGFLGLGFRRFRHSGFRVTLAKVTTIGGLAGLRHRRAEAY